MKIGFDVDGVLTDLENYQLEYGKKYFGEDKLVNENGYTIQEIFGCSKEEEEKFWIKYIWKYCLKEQIRENVINYIKRLKSEGNEIHIITGRAHTTEQNATGKLFRKMLLYKLKEAGIDFDSIVYCSESKSAEDKLKACKKIGIDVMFEDKAENIKELSEICKVVCFDAKYNKDVNGDNIIRVNPNDNLNQKLSSVISNDIYKKDYVPFKKDEFKFSYGIIRNIGVPMFKMAYKPTIINKEFIPKEGPIILCGNHLHVWDQFPVISSTSRTTHWMAKKEYFDSKLGPIFRKTGAISVDRFGDASEAENKAINYLKVGSAVGMFAEGTRNKLKPEDAKKIYNEVLCDNPYVKSDTFYENVLNHKKSQIDFILKLYKENRISKGLFWAAFIVSNLDSFLKTLVQNRIITQDEYNSSLLLPFKFGCVSMAKKTNSQIVPFAVTGDYEIGSKNLMVRYGEPYYVRSNDLEKENEILKNKILNLVIDNNKCQKKQ